MKKEIGWKIWERLLEREIIREFPGTKLAECRAWKELNDDENLDLFAINAIAAFISGFLSGEGYSERDIKAFKKKLESRIPELMKDAEREIRAIYDKDMDDLYRKGYNQKKD